MWVLAWLASLVPFGKISGLSLELELFYSWFGLFLEVLPAIFHLLLADLECSNRWDIYLVENLVCILKRYFYGDRYPIYGPPSFPRGLLLLSDASL